jgi:hypothetical protein
MAVFGIVMLIKPVVWFGPVIVKVTVVVLAVGYEVIVALDICELITFPLILRLIVAPESVVADTVFDEGDGVGGGVGVGTAPGLGVGDGAGVGADVGEGDDIGVGVGLAVGVGVGANVTVNVLLVTA